MLWRNFLIGFWNLIRMRVVFWLSLLFGLWWMRLLLSVNRIVVMIRFRL